MDKLGYEMRWTNTRKNITYIEKANPNHKCRDNNLHEEKFLKEKMEEEFEIRERLASLEREEQTYDFDYGESDISNNSRERLLESTDRTEQKSESKSGFDFGNATQQGTEEEMDSDILWNDDRSSDILSNSFCFAGNLFKMINNETKYHRKRIKLSQKEIEKRIAHGQKSDGYEEYEDYTQSM